MPRLQKVVKNAAQMPNRMKYSPASVALVMFLKRNENTRMTAATTVSTSWPKSRAGEISHAASSNAL